ncbi:MAG: tRNA uridine(34) 5-carboxymethylaminomethyl modification radical SAM/GNAT enzyme Elp3 [Candidatus Moranbacteria bacterium CG23_combo_of_CG06-09_8_20_14_all_35_22]|nr:MAG: tRNA uridine(34) 5-carboxymethylaminomethyl modification radical SAM/GNAT enzyme Elp3 [Candidatus Moranbacteria bacterium CG23_combo_of_CG06-09_8_20_14_all_35_22]
MLKAYDNFIKIATKTKITNPELFSKRKKEICKELGLPLPTNADIREVYEKMLSAKKIKRNLNLEKALFSKKIRTDSGVAVVAVLTKSYPCPGKCIYCPTEKEMPKSYLSNEPAVMRAISAKFNPYIQVQRRIRALELNGHKTDKIEIIVMGGTFSYLPKTYQKKFILECFRACNDYPKSKNKEQGARNNIKIKLENEQKKNETAKHRIVGLTLETRPDYINAQELINFRNLGCTRVELGVQSIFDDVLEKNKRGHNVQRTIEATQLLKDFGFKINYHIMPGLLGSSVKKDFQMFQELFSNQPASTRGEDRSSTRGGSFQPDMLKIYPTVVIKQSPLYKIWKAGKYKALTDKNFSKFILRVKNEIIPPYVRISRLVRDVPESSILTGPKISNLRQLIAKNSACPCIRCREVRSDYNLKEKIILHRIDYDASGGKEIFLEYVSKDKKKLFALLRLRINGSFASMMEAKLPNVLKNSAIIREVHTYGKMNQINQKDALSPQHIGLGKKLILEAEKIAKKEFNLDKIAVISGVGVRGYYRKLGYKLKDSYMVKKL